MRKAINQIIPNTLLRAGLCASNSLNISSLVPALKELIALLIVKAKIVILILIITVLWIIKRAHISRNGRYICIFKCRLG